MTTNNTTTNNNNTNNNAANAAFEIFARFVSNFLHYGCSEENHIQGLFRPLYNVLCEVFFDLEPWERGFDMSGSFLERMIEEGELEIREGVRLKGARERLLKFRLFLASVWQEKTGGVWGSGVHYMHNYKAHRSWGELTPTAKKPTWVSPTLETYRCSKKVTLSYLLSMYLERSDWSTFPQHETMLLERFHSEFRLLIDEYQRQIQTLEQLLTVLVKETHGE